MKTFRIDGQTGNCEIILGESISNLNKYCNREKTVIITDPNVNFHYGNLFSKFSVIITGTGEECKTLDIIKDIYKQFLELQVDRLSLIVGIGGGIVCDITGFAASTYMRGIPFGFDATTLLAQVDASTGGKNGVNFEGYKNIIGTFNQPEFVICDFNVLKTLPHKELSCGFAEVIKHAVIKDERYFRYLEENYSEILSLRKNEIKKIVQDSISIKTEIVQSDEKEKGNRKKLNFGHTLGHGIEKIAGLPHGEAVALGMIFASNFSVLRGILQKNDGERIKKLLKKFNLSIEVKLNKKDLMNAIKKDKKRHSAFIDFVLLEKIGTARIFKVSIDELDVAIDEWVMDVG